MRLPFWSRPAPDERQHAIATLQSLGTTSVPGLAAALSWSVPHTEQVLGELLRHGSEGISYDMRTGTLRWGAPASPSTRSSTPTPPPRSTPSWGAAASPGLTRPVTDSPAVTHSPPARAGGYYTPAAPPTVLPASRVGPSDRALRECARCHTPLVPTGDADVFACPMCGRRVTGSGSLVSPSPSRAGAPAGPDPKVQQLIAAWATGQPAPCPACRQPLRHTTDGEFRCGSCGLRVAYGGSTSTTAPPPAPEGPVVGPSR